MFYLSLIEHKMLLPPRLLNLPLQDAIKEELQNIFLDKVVTISLCIFLPFCPWFFHIKHFEVLSKNGNHRLQWRLYQSWDFVFQSMTSEKLMVALYLPVKVLQPIRYAMAFLFCVCIFPFFAGTLSIIDVFYVNIVLSIWNIYPLWTSNLCVVCGDFFHFIYLCFFQ